MRQPQNHSPISVQTRVPSSRREDTIEIAGEVAKIGEEGPQVHLRPDRRQRPDAAKNTASAQREAQALARDRLAIGVIERGQLLTAAGQITATVMRSASSRDAVRTERAGSRRPGLSSFHVLQSGRLLLAQIVDELDQLDGLVVVVIRGRRMPRQFLPSDSLSKAALSLVGSVEERLLDRGLHVVRQVAEIGVGRVDDEVRLQNDAEILLLQRRAIGRPSPCPWGACASGSNSSSAFHQLAATSTVPCASASTAFSWLPVKTTLPKNAVGDRCPCLFILKRGTLLPEVEFGSTRPRFLPFRSSMLLVRARRPSRRTPNNSPCVPSAVDIDWRRHRS